MIIEHAQARNAKKRLRIVQHCQQISRNVSRTCRFLGSFA
jgi:hypothetical protein